MSAVDRAVASCAFSLRNRWFADSPLEEAGFEPLVPRHAVKVSRAALRLISRRRRSRPLTGDENAGSSRGTEGSNPVPSGGESANYQFRSARYCNGLSSVSRRTRSSRPKSGAVRRPSYARSAPIRHCRGRRYDKGRQLEPEGRPHSQRDVTSSLNFGSEFARASPQEGDNFELAAPPTRRSHKRDNRRFAGPVI